MAVEIAANLVIQDVVLPTKTRRQLENIKVPGIDNIDSLNRNIRTLDRSIGLLTTQYEILSTSGRNVARTNNEVAASSKNTTKEIRQSTSALVDFADKGALAARRFAAFSIAAGGAFASVRTAVQGFRDAFTIERDLIRVAQVTDKSLGDIQRTVGRTIGELSKTFATNANELNKVALTFAQAQGSAAGLRDALEAVAKSNLAPTFDSIDKTAEGLVAASRQFNLGASQYEGALDRINKVSASFAVESADIFRAIQKSGAVFDAASTDTNSATESLERFISAFTSVRAQTRESADTIATGLRTVFTRLQRNSTIDFLRQFDIELTNVDGTFIGISKAINEVGTALDSLPQGSATRARILEEIGGFRQIGRTIPLFSREGRDIANEAFGVQRRADGSINEDVNQALETTAVRIENLRNRLTDLFVDISNTAGFKALTDGFFNVTNSILSVVEATKELIPLFAALGAARLTSSVFGSGAAGAFTSRFFTGQARLPRRQTGGYVPGSGSGDRQLLLAEAGEFVIKKSTAQKLGPANLNALNNFGGIQRAQNGGLVGNPNFRTIAEIFQLEASDRGVSNSQSEKIINQLSKSSLSLESATNVFEKVLTKYDAVVTRDREQQKQAGRVAARGGLQGGGGSASSLNIPLSAANRSPEVVARLQSIDRNRSINSVTSAGLSLVDDNVVLSRQLDVEDQIDFAKGQQRGRQERQFLERQRRAERQARKNKDIADLFAAQDAVNIKENARKNTQRRLAQNDDLDTLTRRASLPPLTPEERERNRRRARNRGRIRSFRRSFFGSGGPFIPPFGGGGPNNPNGPSRFQRGSRLAGNALSGIGATSLFLASNQFDRQTAGSGAAGSGLAGAGGGALAGSSFGPQGALVGAVIGGTLGAINGIFEGALNEASNAAADSLDNLATKTSEFEQALANGSATFEQLTDVLSASDRLQSDTISLQSARGDGIFARTLGSNGGARGLGALQSLFRFDIAGAGRTLFDRKTDFSFAQNSENLLEQSGQFGTFDRLQERFAELTGNQDQIDSLAFKRTQIEERQRQRNAEEIASQNRVAANAASNFIEQEARAGRINNVSQITDKIARAIVSNNANLIQGTSQAQTAEGRRAAEVIITRVQAELAVIENLSKFQGTLILINESAQRTADTLKLFDQELGAGAASRQSIINRAGGNFSAQTGGRVNLFSNLGIANRSEIEGGIRLLESQFGGQISGQQRGLLQSNVGFRAVPELLRQSLTGAPIQSEQAAADFRKVAETLTTSGPLQSLPEELRKTFREAVAGIGDEEIFQFQQTGELPAAFKTLKDTIDTNNGSFEALAQRTNAFRDAVASAGNDLKNLLVRGINLRSGAAGAAAGAIRTRTSLFGGNIGAEVGTALDLAGVRGLTGNTTDPRTIGARIENNNRIISRLNRVGSSQTNGEFVANQARQSELNAENTALQQSLEKLSQNIAGLTSIQEELTRIEQKKTATRGAAFGLLFGGPEETRRQARGQSALNILLGGGGLQGVSNAGLTNQDLQVGFEARRSLIQDPEQRDAFEAQFARRAGITGLAAETTNSIPRVKELKDLFDANAKVQQEAYAELRKINDDNVNAFKNEVLNNFRDNIIRLEEAFNTLNIPEKIEMEVQHSPIPIEINGLDVFQSLQPMIQERIIEQVNIAINANREGAT